MLATTKNEPLPIISITDKEERDHKFLTRIIETHINVAITITLDDHHNLNKNVHQIMATMKNIPSLGSNISVSDNNTWRKMN